MALALNNLKKVDMPLNKETKPNQTKLHLDRRLRIFILVNPLHFALNIDVKDPFSSQVMIFLTNRLFLSLERRLVAMDMRYCLFSCSRKNFVCLVRKLFWLMVSPYIFTQWGWRIPFGPDDFPGQIEFGESPPNYLLLKILRAGRMYFRPLSSWRRSCNIMRRAI